MAKAAQLGFEFPKGKVGWGGRRDGAGRKKTGKKYVRHRVRPWHDGNVPVHVTYKIRRGLPSLRLDGVAAAIVEAIRGCHKPTFRVCHYSIQADHVHMIVEAGSKVSLSRGMQGLAVRIVKRVNRALGRHGKLFKERYHARDLATPTEVRNALRYVLLNRAKHIRPGRGAWVVDDRSSGPWFHGWAWDPCWQEGVMPPNAPIAEARTALLRWVWRRAGGYIDPAQTPGVRDPYDI